jgi:glycosyltransferase involved in cell wall biosynthesis
MRYLAACCTVKNEANIILEWMAFHRAVGIEKLIIIDNGSTDSTVDIIRSFRDQDSIELILSPERVSQVDLYNRVLHKYANEIEWCAFIDADEFLYPTDGFDLRTSIPQFGEIGAIAVHWHIYGSSGYADRPEGLVIENYLRRAESDFVFNRHVKCIVNLKNALRPLTSHLFEVKHGIYDDAGNDLHMGPPYGFFEDKPATHKIMRINHYHVRSKNEYYEKSMRGYFGVDDEKLEGEKRFNEMFSAHDRNEIEDATALRFLPLMRFYMRLAEPA